MSTMAKPSPISASAELLFDDHAQEFMLHNNGIGTYDEVFNGEKEQNLPTFFFTRVTGVMFILRTDKTLLLLLLPAGSQR